MTNFAYDTPKTRSRILILNHIAQFSLQRYCGAHSFDGDPELSFQVDRNPPDGSLVALSAAPSSKWYLAWLHETELHPHGYHSYLLESIEDGELVWGNNVGLNVYSSSEVAAHPEWRWSDAQHEFNSEWNRVCRVCREERDAYLYLPMRAEFSAGGSGVVLRMRTRYNCDDVRYEKHFENWMELTSKEMLAFYDEGEAFYKERGRQKKAEREAREAQQ